MRRAQQCTDCLCCRRRALAISSERTPPGKRIQKEHVKEPRSAQSSQVEAVEEATGWLRITQRLLSERYEITIRFQLRIKIFSVSAL